MALSAGLAGTRRSCNLNNALSSGGFQAPGASKVLDTAPPVSVSMVGTAAPIGPSASKRVLLYLYIAIPGRDWDPAQMLRIFLRANGDGGVRGCGPTPPPVPVAFQAESELHDPAPSDVSLVAEGELSVA